MSDAGSVRSGPRALCTVLRRATPVARERAPTDVFADHAGSWPVGANLTKEAARFALFRAEQQTLVFACLIGSSRLQYDRSHVR
jgi:hypothetical protein